MASTKKATAVPAYDDSEWRAESDMRTLAEAEAIKRDPKRLSKARACAKKKLAELQAVAKT
jgi:hypothetical protein